MRMVKLKFLNVKRLKLLLLFLFRSGLDLIGIIHTDSFDFFHLFGTYRRALVLAVLSFRYLFNNPIYKYYKVYKYKK